MSVTSHAPVVARLGWLATASLLVAAALWVTAARPVAAAELGGEGALETLPGLPPAEASIHLVRQPVAPAAAGRPRGGWQPLAWTGLGGLAGGLTGLGVAPALGLQPQAAAVLGGALGAGTLGAWAAFHGWGLAPGAAPGPAAVAAQAR
ncbi:MAG: hypothetical protein VKS61_09775 [Candidatus Sericytochromatia bacterium]|nr:hypothetical protein [Candidatus Sericytochromatia bacterium]